MKHPYKIPADIYDHVLETMLAIVNADLNDDSVLSASFYEQLREFCEAQTAAGRGSGFMWEALADLTQDESTQLSYYERSLTLARHNSEPTHTVLIEIGRIHAERRDWSRAEPLLLAARNEAIASDDPESEGEAASLLLQMPVKSA
jgi:hypothetical protein